MTSKIFNIYNKNIKYFKINSFDDINLKKYFNLIKNKNIIVLTININEFYGLNDLKNFLNKLERSKIKDYLRDKDRKCFLIGHSIINYLFSNWIGCKIEELNIQKSLYGKPYIKNTYNINYNITHSMDIVGICIGNYNIGIDIEYINKNINFQTIIKNTFQKDCKKGIYSIDTFYKYWVAKEAYIKLKASSINRLLRFLSASEISNNTIKIVDHDHSNLQCIHIFYPEKNYKGALAIENIYSL